MRYAFIVIIMIFSMGAFSASTQDKNTTATNPPTAKPVEEPTQLDDLIRGELAALKAYDQALKDVKEPKQREKLQAIRDDHEKAVSRLSKYVAAKPELLEDTKEAGPWGKFAKVWTKTRSFTGNEGALKALKDGEEHGIEEYQEALEDDSIPKELKQAIKNDMLPQQKQHMKTLNKMI